MSVALHSIIVGLLPHAAPCTITSLLPRDTPAVHALRADDRCALLFYVFDLDDRSEEGRFRCLQVNCRAEVHEDGPLFENV